MVWAWIPLKWVIPRPTFTYEHFSNLTPTLYSQKCFFWGVWQSGKKVLEFLWTKYGVGSCCRISIKLRTVRQTDRQAHFNGPSSPTAGTPRRELADGDPLATRPVHLWCWPLQLLADARIAGAVTVGTALTVGTGHRLSGATGQGSVKGKDSDHSKGWR